LTALASLAEGKWENQVKSVALLSPIAYLSQMKSILGRVAARSLLSQVYSLINSNNYSWTWTFCGRNFL